MSTRFLLQYWEYYSFGVLIMLVFLIPPSNCSVFPKYSQYLMPNNVEASEFNPYSDNGGTVIGIAGSNFVLVAADTRMSDRYLILSRNTSHIFELGERSLMAASGCWADIVSLRNEVGQVIHQYEWQHRKILTIQEVSTFLASTLYSRRSLPFFASCLLCGLDSEGHGIIYNFDPLGSKEIIRAGCKGKGEHLIQSFLDELTEMEQNDAMWELTSEVISSSEDYYCKLTIHDAIALAENAFKAAAEREISIGDGLEIIILRNKNDAGCKNKVCIERIILPLPQH